MRVLLIEDDQVLGNGIHTWLGLKGYAVDWLRDGWLAQQAIQATEYGIVLLDLGLPMLEGMEVLKNVRARKDFTPVIVITARDGMKDRIAGLDSGADDYLVKPFEMEELAARMRALERRNYHRVNPVLSHGALSLDPAAMEVTYKGARISLSPREFALLRTLLENKGTPVSRSKLESGLYAWDEEVESNAVTVHIHNLRKKLGDALIVTKRGIGYIIV